MRIVTILLSLLVSFSSFAQGEETQAVPTEIVSKTSSVDNTNLAEHIAAKEEVDAFQSFANNTIGAFNSTYSSFLFYKIPFLGGLPLVLLVTITGALFFTFRFGFINIKLFTHAINVIRGKYDNPDDEGEISHFQALTSALSATVGLGNIGGVAVAVGAGGPGTVFWLWVFAFFGMSLKFSSCTFAQLYRTKDHRGEVLGGPMVYLSQGLGKLGLKKVGVLFGLFFSLATILASFGGGNLFQTQQTFEIINAQFPGTNPYVVGTTLAFLAGIVLIGGIKRIGEVTSKIVPAMCGFYVITCLTIIFGNWQAIPSVFESIFRGALEIRSIGWATFMVVLIEGLRRASFSNEAGLGSAAIAHAAAKTNEPVREGVVAMIGPVIDTHIVCTMTAITILVTGAHTLPEFNGKGVEMTAHAFSSLGEWMPYLLTAAICVFAYSTVISWSYYGERATEYLFGKRFGTRAILIYRLIYVFVIMLGPHLALGAVIEFSDLALLSMAFVNISGMMLMSGTVKSKVDDYLRRFRSGKMPTYETKKTIPEKSLA